MAAHMAGDSMHRSSRNPQFNKDKNSNQRTHDDGKMDGRVGRLDTLTMGYYRRVSDTIKDGFQNDHEKGLFLDNVFEHLEKEEIKLCQNQTVSRIFEELLLISQPRHILQFLGSVLDTFELATKDRFAGHVVQKALLVAVASFEVEGVGVLLQEKVLLLAQALMSSLDDVMMNDYGSHILRTMLQILGGVRVPEQFSRSKLSRDQQQDKSLSISMVTSQDVPEMLLRALKDITNCLLRADNFSDYLLHKTSSPVLEVLLLVLHRAQPALCHRLCQAILKRSKVTKQTNERIPLLLADSIGSHLFEVVIETMSGDSLAELCAQTFTSCILKMALHPKANYVVQKLIKRAATEAVFDGIYNPLCAGMESILGVNHMGVILRLAEACVLLPTKQSGFIKSLLKAFHCWEPKERQSSCVQLMCGMLTHEVFFGQTAEQATSDTKQSGHLTVINIHGSLLIQQLLQFSHCGTIIAGFVCLSDADLTAIATCAPGSFLLEAFMMSGMVSERKKNQFALKTKTLCFQLACHKTGSRSIEAIFKASSLPTKTEICQTLLEKERQLQSDYFGKFVYHNFEIRLFKQRTHDWEELQGQGKKKRKLFADIIGDYVNPTSKGKVKKTMDPVSASSLK